MTAPLDDVRVIEVDSFMAAPSAGAVLADLGADVIKVEPLSGDPMRGIGRPAKVEGDLAGYDFQFDVDNRGKRSIAVALDTEQGQALVQRLCRDAQVFMCNLLPHRQKKFALDPKTLLGVAPGLVHATLTGYGTTGPEALRPGFDVTAFFGRSGLSDASREGDDGLMAMPRPAQGDHAAGLALTSAILAALRLAERSGEGQVVETSLYETAVWSQASDFATTAVDRAPVRRRTRDQQLSITLNRFRCADGRWVVLCMPGSRTFAPLAKALGLDDLIDDERFADSRGRYKNMSELLEIVDARFLERTRDEWGELFDAHGVVWGPAFELHEVPSDPQAEAIGLFPNLDHPERGAYPTVNIPMRFSTADVAPRGPAPTIGEHTRAVLAEAGFDDAEITALIDSGAIG